MDCKLKEEHRLPLEPAVLARDAMIGVGQRA
jgi:hypothetical protein